MEAYDPVHMPMKLMIGLCIIYKMHKSYIPPKIRFGETRDL